jgi:hypothetical protein
VEKGLNTWKRKDFDKGGKASMKPGDKLIWTETKQKKAKTDVR